MGAVKRKVAAILLVDKDRENQAGYLNVQQ